MAYDAWKADDSLYAAHELGEPANDVLRLAVPQYKLDVSYDKWLRLTTARLLVLTVPSQGWRRLDEAVCPEDDTWEAIARMRTHRRLARSYARAS